MDRAQVIVVHRRGGVMIFADGWVGNLDSLVRSVDDGERRSKSSLRFWSVGIVAGRKRSGEIEGEGKGSVRRMAEAEGLGGAGSKDGGFLSKVRWKRLEESERTSARDEGFEG